MLSELGESASNLTQFRSRAETNTLRLLIRLKNERERRRRERSNLSCFAKSVSLRADRVACRRGKLPRSATNKVVQGGTIRLKRYYARDTKVRYRLRDFVEIARAPLDRIN